MRRGRRFGLWVALAAMATAAASFAIGLQVLDDGKPDPSPSGGVVDGALRPSTSSTATPTAPSSTTAVPGRIRTPAWVAIVASEKSRADAEAAAAEVAAAAYPAGVLKSDDYESLNQGLWVGYAGPYESAKDAKAAVAALKDDGIDGAYVQCVGSKDECKGEDDDD